MTDLEQFIEFFRMKGVPFEEDDVEPYGLVVNNAIFQFNDCSEFIGVFNSDTGFLALPRLPAPETKPKKSKSVECEQCSVHFTPKHKHQGLCSDRCAEIYNSRYKRGEQ